jgi:uncharacterized protein with HEPN domain
MAKRTPRHRLFDILNAMRHIEKIVAGLDQAAFMADSIRYRAVERELEIISEAGRAIDEEDREAFPDVPWRRIADIGNILRHQYEDIAPALIWEIAAHGLEPLKVAVTALYAKVKRPSDPWPDAEAK